MAKKIVPLTDTKVKRAKPREKGYKLFDGHGLFLWIDKKGGKLWRFKYKSPATGKERTYSMGRYPDISLVSARKRRQELREKIAEGIDPMEEKQSIKIKQKKEEVKRADTFEKIAEDYLGLIAANLSEGHLKRQRGRLEKDIYPYIGSTPISEVSRLDIIAAIQKIEQRGAIETAHRVFYLCSNVFKYAVTNEKIPYNILADIDKKHILQSSPEKHYPVLTNPKDIKALLAAIDGYRGEIVTRFALKLLPYLAARPGNVRMAKWENIDFKKSQWAIPGEEMKVRVKRQGIDEYQPHIVPLSTQAMAIIDELRLFTGDGIYLFPSPLSKSRPMSDNTLSAAFRRMGYKGQMNPHSFRSLFSTVAHENINIHGFHSDIIERQLAHKERNSVKAAYDHSEYLPQRKELMQWWADFLDGVKAEK